MALDLKPLAGLFQKGFLNSILIFHDMHEIHKTNKTFMKTAEKTNLNYYKATTLVVCKMRAKTDIGKKNIINTNALFFFSIFYSIQRINILQNSII